MFFIKWYHFWKCLEYFLGKNVMLKGIITSLKPTHRQQDGLAGKERPANWWGLEFSIWASCGRREELTPTVAFSPAHVHCGSIALAHTHSYTKLKLNTSDIDWVLDFQFYCLSFCKFTRFPEWLLCMFNN